MEDSNTSDNIEQTHEEQEEKANKGIALGIGSHPITNQLGVNLISKDGKQSIDIFLSFEDALALSTRLQSMATMCQVMTMLGMLNTPDAGRKGIIVPK